jgi:hypothetical protein
MEKARIVETVKNLIEMLVSGRFYLVYELDFIKSISKEDLKNEILAFPGQLTMPPSESFQTLDIYETNFNNQLCIDFPLWFNHTESDLTLQCRIFDVDGGQYRYSIEDIHVL